MATASLLIVRLIPLAFLFVLTGCAVHQPLEEAACYQSQPGPYTLPPPVFVVDNDREPYNRIGTPAARPDASGAPEIIVDPQLPTLYYGTAGFTTPRGKYTNFVYRIHFPEVPFSFPAVNLTAGKNPGLLIIYTVDSRDHLLLVTTVHTCGCYLAFFPTSELPRAYYPPDWPTDGQRVFGYILPSVLNIAPPGSRLHFAVSDETHRISDVTASPEMPPTCRQEKTMEQQPLRSLYTLPYQDTTVSFYEHEGRRSGYVKNNTKILERLLISWWAFDLYVGEDKAYGGGDNTDTKLYTSLKFWAREQSDLKHFARFLKYWGWGL